MPEIVLVYTTWPDAETAQAAAAGAVADRLAACANILQPIQSIYHWQGAVERSGEIPVLFKTQASVAPALSDYLAGQHPYETPCIVAMPIATAGSSDAFLAWVAQQTPAPETD